MNKLLAIALGVLLLSLPATAHDTWSNGDPVPRWVKDQCCGPQDAHRLNPEDVSQNENGDYKIRGYPYVIPRDRALPSQDGYYWAFYRDYRRDPLIGDGNVHDSIRDGFSSIYCFFIPLSG